MRGGWIGVDLDGTLAVDCTCAADVWTVGDPIPGMVAIVKALLAEGRDVRIFTARVGACGQTSTIATDDQAFAEHQRELIAAWCLDVFGQVLPVTATKDFQLDFFYDDRAIEVVTNAGQTLRQQIGDGIIKALRETLDPI